MLIRPLNRRVYSDQRYHFSPIVTNWSDTETLGFGLGLGLGVVMDSSMSLYIGSFL